MVNKKIIIDLNGVEKTLLMPLWGRAKETEKHDPLVTDSYANEIINKVDYDFTKMESGFSEVERLTWIFRAFHFDNTIKNFILTNTDPLIINIGAGLDTTFYRIDNGKVRWVNLDLPEVILLREKLMPVSKRVKSIGKSVFDLSWIDDISTIAKDKSVMICAAGVFFYFEQDQLKKLFYTIADVFLKAQLVFDSFPWFIVWLWNKELKKGKKGKLDPSAVLMKWHLNKASGLKKWVNTLTVVDEYPMCSRVEYKKEWSKKLIFQMKVMNFLRLYNMVHIQFE